MPVSLDVTLDDTVWKRILTELKNANRSYVKVGVIGAAAMQKTADGVSMAELALIHTYGSPKRSIPARPFIAEGINAQEAKIKTLTEKLAEKVSTGKLTIQTALATLGEAGAAAVKRYVKSGPYIRPLLKAATIEAKGSSRPLIDSSRMINSVSYEIVSK